MKGSEDEFVAKTVGAAEGLGIDDDDDDLNEMKEIVVDITLLDKDGFDETVIGIGGLNEKVGVFDGAELFRMAASYL